MKPKILFLKNHDVYILLLVNSTNNGNASTIVSVLNNDNDIKRFLTQGLENVKKCTLHCSHFLFLKGKMYACLSVHKSHLQS